MVLPSAAAVLPLAPGQDLTYGQWRAQMRNDDDGASETRALGCGRAAGGGGAAVGAARQLGEASSGEEQASGDSSPSAPAPSEPMCASGTLYFLPPNPYPYLALALTLTLPLTLPLTLTSCASGTLYCWHRCMNITGDTLLSNPHPNPTPNHNP